MQKLVADSAASPDISAVQECGSTVTVLGPVPAFSQEPPVSVVVGCFNQAAFVETALRSVVQQSNPNFECVVIDDASTDQSQDRIRGFLAELSDKRFRFESRTVNGGQMTTMMQGFDATTSPFVAFLDADDCWNADFLEKHVRAQLSRDGVAAISTSDEAIVDEVGRVLAGGTAIFRDDDPRRAKRGGGRIRVVGAGEDTLVFVGRQATGWLWSTTSGMMFRRDAVQAMRPLDAAQIRICADAYLALAAHMLGGTVRLERVLGSYRVHHSNGWANRGILGDDCRTGSAPPQTDEKIRAAIAERWCAIAPDLAPIISKRVMGRTLVSHFGWAAAFDMMASNPQARDLLVDWARPSRRRLFQLAMALPRPLRPRLLR